MHFMFIAAISKPKSGFVIVSMVHVEMVDTCLYLFSLCKMGRDASYIIYVFVIMCYVIVPMCVIANIRYSYGNTCIRVRV